MLGKEGCGRGGCEGCGGCEGRDVGGEGVRGGMWEGVRCVVQ